MTLTCAPRILTTQQFNALGAIQCWAADENLDGVVPCFDGALVLMESCSCSTVRVNGVAACPWCSKTETAPLDTASKTYGKVWWCGSCKWRNTRKGSCQRCGVERKVML